MNKQKKVNRANIEYHTKMADFYDKDQPHFRLENVERVESVIKDLAERYGNGSLLDIGCGTGFILSIAKKYFDRIVGVDITQAMLDKVDVSSGNIELRLADSVDIPFDDERFDVCTAYGFLHHLPKLPPTFREVYRCLKKGGAFYADQDPNYYYRREISKLLISGGYSKMLENEINSRRGVYGTLKSRYGLDEETAKLAEFQNLTRGGMREESVINSLERTGFLNVKFKYQWFLGEGHVLHSISEEAVKYIGDYLREFLPLSRCLFKYFSFIAKKGGLNQ